MSDTNDTEMRCPSEESIREYLQEKIKDKNDYFQKSAALQEAVFNLWSNFITDPADPSSTETPSPKNFNDITGVSLNCTGDAIPLGRWARTNISITAFSRFLRKYKISRKNASFHWKPFAEALLCAYWRIYGRDVAIAHHFLHEMNTSSRIVQMEFCKLTALPSAMMMPLLTPTSGSLLFGRLVRKFAFNTEGAKDKLRDFILMLLRKVGAKKNDGEELSTEDYIEIADQTYFQSAKDCFVHTLHKANAEVSVAIYQSSPDFILKFDELLVGNRPGEHDHDKHKRRDRSIKALQLLMIYREMAGDYFYVITPKINDKDKLQYVFTFWSKKSAEQYLKSMLEYVECLSRVANVVLVDDIAKPKYTIPAQEKMLGGIVGDSLCYEFKDALRNLPAYTDHKQMRIPEYLILADQIAQVAVHEGQKLRFCIHVSGGKAASKLIQYVSGLPTSNKNNYLKWEIEPEKNHESDISSATLSHPSIISLLVGNYSFFQDKKFVIQASPWGHLQYLGSLFDSTDPEIITKDGDNLLIVIEPNADIKVFFGFPDDGQGKLRLWRRDGKWIMPKKYGQDFINTLNLEIGTMLGVKAEETEKYTWLETLCECTWELSTKERRGACFIIVNDQSNGKGTDWMNFFPRMTNVLPFAENRQLLTRSTKEILKRLAVQDGATIVDLQTGKVSGRRHILVEDKNRTLAEWRQEIEEKPDSWEKQGLHRLLRWGSRHHSALATAKVLNDVPKISAVVVTISSDGDIHLLTKEGLSSTCSYPHSESNT